MSEIDFDKWKENITVSLWGQGKATLVDDKLCLDTALTGQQVERRYKGNCDECKWFMGCHTNGNPNWGAHRKGCCWLQVEQLKTGEKQ